ncbi:MAG: hypothetical protein HOP33_12150 [Verrucomicrobia bacterium]|nr:hypothetical protein [Verrucomicrobiota bacterium]
MADTKQPESFLARFLVLKGAARELWITFAVKFLGVTAYKLMNVTLVLWLSSDFGFSAQMALRLVLAWSLSMTVVVLLVGTKQGANIVFNWPTNAPGFALQWSTNLETTIWSNATLSPLIVSGQYTVKRGSVPSIDTKSERE